MESWRRRAEKHATRVESLILLLASGLQIWCIENLRLVSVPTSAHGKFFSGSAYIVLNTVLLKGGALQFEVHYWLGNDANEVDSGLASDKALELDEALGSQTVQYREVQGQETEKFLSYFKPCIIPVEGTFSSGPGQSNGDAYETRLLTCKGDRVVHVKEVTFSRSSLNHNDVFILDTASRIFMFSGCNSSIQERAKALEVVEYIKEYKHRGKCDVATIEDGKFVGDAHVGEFWSFFGGYAPIPRDAPQEQPQRLAVKLFWITLQGKLNQIGSETLKKAMLESNKCFMLDDDSQVFVWMGRRTSITERKTSISAAEDFLRSQERSINTHLTFSTEGSETALFKSYFDDWPQKVEPKLYEDGRGKVAAIFKHQGYEVEELPDEEEQSFIDCNGTLKVWRVNGEELSLVPKDEQRKLFGGDCYLVQYRYPGNGREEHLFYIWLGGQSSKEERAEAISHASAIADSSKGEPVVAQIVENKEPNQFFIIFQTLIIMKGGLGACYKSSIAEKGLADETYDDNKTAFFRVQGTNRDNMQAIQVDQVARSLNSSYCYILKTETSVFTWLGNLSTARDHDLLHGMLDLINPTWQPIIVREGNEPYEFWNALGGKTEYPREKEIKGFIEDPRLFVCIFAESAFSSSRDFKVKEIFNFSQDDLTTEDVLVLSCHCEIYVWVGRNSNIKSKQQALTVGLKILEEDILAEGLSLDTPLYTVTEGHEPPFFTRFFEWDSSKANMLGNSFERKLAILSGKGQKLEAPPKSSMKVYSKETTPNGSRGESIGSFRRSASPSSRVSSSNSTPLLNRRFSSPAPISGFFFSGSSPDIPKSGEALVSTSSTAGVESLASENSGLQQVDQNQTDANLVIYPYERLKVTSNDPVIDIDLTKREAYLSEEEFKEKFTLSKGDFYQLPKWKQNKLKVSLFLF